ncbi:unnamed protein product [Trichogramma brassicae]|uniref:Uncharacterized protein n=1 Tax=Trichogramma brassicae TaxID=86971 RepID=A0A6H5HUP1_9HYME|nr:unnamed protein product [Trichogramma brassicae]
MASIVTKRGILSDVAKLFDPLGWLAPDIVTAKILLQDLWIEKVDWNTPLEGELLSRWRSFRGSLRNVEQIRVPRWDASKSLCGRGLHGDSED